MQYFKGDETELKFVNAGLPAFTGVSLSKAAFFDGCYDAAPLGQLIWDLKASSIARGINRAAFSVVFNEIFNRFNVAGTFELYIDVFKLIFGEDAEIEFTVPAPGKLEIEISAAEATLFDFIAATIEDNDYTFDEVVDDTGDNIAFATIAALVSQYETEQFLYQLAPGGIFTTITLTIG